MSLKIPRESNLNLPLQGSVGSFRVGTGVEGQQSLEVKYFLTHVGLNFATGTNDALLSELAPVREIFDFETLEFDEIMQRDIDDARVSAELIPYLLDESSKDLVKLFPPIIVVVLPVHEDRNRPAPFYPERFEGVTRPETTGGDPGQYILRVGDVGQEVFQFEQPISEGKRLAHDLARFRINTHRARLVIVDGQHRAMALLAIYRNLKDQWSDARRAPYREYYSEWTPNYINKFNLTDIELPVMFCTVPSLDSAYEGDFDLRKAARAIFLTLNKTARAVSNSRNILLDDNDLMSVFLRRCLSRVKSKDLRSPFSFRIWNVELDQFRDKLRIQSPMALTGVSHLYYIVEHLLMDSGDVTGIAPRSGYFQIRTKLDNCLDRLEGRDILGADVADSVRRDNFTDDVTSKLGTKFDERYSRFVISVFEQFAPYEAHNKAAVDLEERVEGFQDRQLRPILFEGQGIGRVFESHREAVRKKLSMTPEEGGFSTDVPQIEAIAKRLDATAKRIETAIAQFRTERAEFFLSRISEKGQIRNEEKKVHAALVKWVDELFQNVLTTVAFEAAIVCGFFGEIEKARSQSPQAIGGEIDVDAAFTEYITQLNSFFTPTTFARLKRIIRIFSGDPTGESVADWRIAASNHTFRSVVYRGEMQPDQWPKYKYLFLELWNPSHEALSKVVDAERQLCRQQVFSSLYHHNKNIYCREHAKLEEDLEKSELATIFDRSLSAYNAMLKSLGGDALTKEFAHGAIAVSGTESEEEGLPEAIDLTDDPIGPSEEH